MKDETRYQVTMNFAKKLLNENVIDEELYMEFDEKMRQKYDPEYSIIFTDLKLKIA